MTVDTIPAFVVVKSDDGKTVDLKPADDLAAEMLVRTYVPEYPEYVTFDEAYNLALKRDAQAASELEASVMAALDSADEGDDAELAAIANTLLGDAEEADRVEREAVGAMGL